MKASPIITSFNSGEFSPLMAGRVDVKFYGSACKRLLNFIPMPQGPARKRPATYFVGEVKTSANRTWLRRFVFSQNQSYILEFGNLYIRFYSGHGIVGGGTPVEVVTPYTTADLINDDGSFALRFAQSGDVLYIAHKNYALRKLSRTGASTFSIAAVTLVGGPFKKIDPDGTTTVYASASTGSVTLTASASTFAATDIGRMILLEQKKVDDIKQWEPAKSITAADLRRSDGKNYKALNTATTGAVKPVHSQGAKYDGHSGVQWEFQDPGYGWAVITAYTSATVVTATVLSAIPAMAVGSGNATNMWAWGEFSATDGYPSDLTFHKDRLTLVRRRDVFGSVAGDFENFSSRDDGGVITKDMSYKVELSSDEANDITWVASMSSALLVGTLGEEFAVRENSSAEAFGPGNIRFDRQSAYGSRDQPAITVGDGVFFVQSAGRKVYDMLMAESVETKWSANDTTILAEHITLGGIISVVHQQEPDSVLWCLRGDGRLVGLTVNRGQEVRGWHPHTIGGDGVVESIDVIPTSTGKELWMIVRRTINGATKRYVEYVMQPFASGNPEYAFYGVDCGLTLDNTQAATLTPGAGADVVGTAGVVFTAGSAIFSAGDVGKYIVYRYTTTNDDDTTNYIRAIAKITAYTDTTHVDGEILAAWPSLGTIASGGWHKTVTSLSGLDHLEGEEVAICADGAAYTPQTVVSGAITLPEPASIIHVGLTYKAVVKPMPIEAGAADGTAQGKTKRIPRCVLRFDKTAGAKYGASELGQMDDVLSRDAGGLMDTAPELFTGDVVVSWPDGYSGDANIIVMSDLPLPCTLVSLMPQITTQDAR